MAKDYDAPRRGLDEGIETDSLEGLKATEQAKSRLDEDGENAEPFDPPMQDLTGEELDVTVIPQRDDEFTCSVCYLVQSTLSMDHVEEDGSPVCEDCA